jgi:hypothetical protein
MGNAVSAGVSCERQPVLAISYAVPVVTATAKLIIQHATTARDGAGLLARTSDLHSRDLKNVWYEVEQSLIVGVRPETTKRAADLLLIGHQTNLFIL